MSAATASCTPNVSEDLLAIDDNRSHERFNYTLGVNVNYAGFAFAGSIGLTTRGDRRVYEMVLQQVWAEARVDLPPGDQIDLFANHSEVVHDGDFSSMRLPVLIDTVSYGRALYLVIETSSRTTELNAALSLAYQQAETCDRREADCTEDRALCNESADVICRGHDDSADCRNTRLSCINEARACIDAARACRGSAAAQVTSTFAAELAASAENVTAFSFGATGTTSITADATTVEERRHRIAEWLGTTPTSFSELIPMSATGVWLAPGWPVALYTLNYAGEELDCRWARGTNQVDPPPPHYELVLEDIDDNAWVWSGGEALGNPGLRFGPGTSRGSLESVASEFGSFTPASRSQRFTVMIGNGGCFNSGGHIMLLRDGVTVWEHTEPRLVRHCGWIYRATIEVDYNTARATREDACVGPADCML